MFFQYTSVSANDAASSRDFQVTIFGTTRMLCIASNGQLLNILCWKAAIRQIKIIYC